MIEWVREVVKSNQMVRQGMVVEDQCMLIELVQTFNPSVIQSFNSSLTKKDGDEYVK